MLNILKSKAITAGYSSPSFNIKSVKYCEINLKIIFGGNREAMRP